MKTCINCKNCKSGIWSINPFISICDFTMAGNIIVNEFGDSQDATFYEKAPYKALTLKQLYRKAGIDLPIADNAGQISYCKREVVVC